MDDLTAFITARLDEDEAAAYALAGTTWTAKRLGDRDYEIHVAHDPLIHAVAPTGSIADVQREDVANWIARHDPRRAQREIAAKRAIVAEHKHYRVDYNLTGRHNLDAPFGCANCHIGNHGDMYDGGWCATLRHLAAVWSDHPGYQQDWSA